MTRFAVVLGTIAAIAGSIAFGQGGYYQSRTVVLEPRTVWAPVTAMPIDVNREDVKAIGMGRAQIAMGTTFTALSYNPALLARTRFALEVPSIQASLPTETYDAIFFMKDHMAEFNEAAFLKDVKHGVDQYKAAPNNETRLAALLDIQRGLRFPRQLLETVIGPSGSPKTHGVLVIPSVTAQVGNWGFSVYGTLQSGFQVIQSSTLERLADVQLPSTLDDIPAITRAITELSSLLDAVLTPEGEIIVDEAMPKAFAVSYMDIVGTAGYGTHLMKNLSVGGAIKIVNRRFSTKRIASDTFDDLLGEVRKDFTENITGVTMDLGALYRFQRTGTEVGISIQNLLPIRSIRSSMNGNFTASATGYDTDAAGHPILNAAGDTALVSYEQKVTIDAPFELQMPIIISVGAHHAITPQWDVALDIHDLTKQDLRYDKYLDRIRIGTEYRLDAIDGSLGIVGRIGMADRQWTLGLGLNIFRVLQIDAAYAHDSYVQTRSYFLQARLGW
jgi:hypothetical protein